MSIFIVVIIGLFIGSFLNVLIDRLPRNEQFIQGRSKCDECNTPLQWMDLLPVVSWVLLRGSCRYCHKKIPMRNSIVELMTASLLALSWFQWMSTQSPELYSLDTVHIALTWIVICSLIVIFFIDLQHYIIPDGLTLLIGVAALAHYVYLSTTSSAMVSFLPLLYSAIGACSFFLFLFLITKGRGMGFGDVKYSFVMGLLLGHPGTIIGLYIAFLTGAGVSAILILRRKKQFGQVVPFGPFLVFGTLIVLLDLVPDVFERIFVPFFTL